MLKIKDLVHIRPATFQISLLTLLGLAAMAFSAPKPVLPPAGKSPKGLYLTPSAPKPLPARTELASFAAGCFWGVEQEFRKTEGVIATAVGYSGGHTPNPNYKQVCDGDTGHAEAVQVEFDPARVTYEQLLDTFWAIHDPTTLDRQGPDVGSQYRSAVFFHSPAQEKAAKLSRDREQAAPELSGSKIVTQIAQAVPFTHAEDYHQQYVEKGGLAQCHYRRKKSR